MKKIVITGGAGFLGSHLCDLFVDTGHEVYCIDNLISGLKSNIQHLMDKDNFHFINHDVTLPLDEEPNDIDAIFHFASPASPNPNSPVSYINNPVETLMVNSLGTKNMLDLAVKNNCQIVLASTSEIYGDPKVHPQTEDYWGNVSPNGERSCYDESKRFLESISFTYHRKFQAKIKVIRIFNTYGPRMRLDDGRFIPSLFASYINNTPFSKFASDSTSRSFCYVDDLISGIQKIYESDNAIGEVYNLGNPDEIKITDAISIFNHIVGDAIEIIEKDELPDDPKRRRPDITKISNDLGWKPTTSLEDGLRNTLSSLK